jgi:hypothetical protein
MRALVIIFLTFTIVFNIDANPIFGPYPPIISEIYFDADGNWYIEFNTLNMGGYNGNFDNLSIETSSDTANFKLGINFTDSIVVITQDSLTSNLSINKNGDFIKIIGYDNSYESQYYFPFGNYEFSYVTALDSGYSYQMADTEGIIYYLAIQSSPSIGFVNNILPTEIFTGHIIDEDSLPIPNLEIRCKITSFNYETHPIYDVGEYDVDLFSISSIQTDQNGYFNNSSLFGRQKYILSFYIEQYYLYDTTIVIDIDEEQINDFTFKLSPNFTNIKKVESPAEIKLSTFPNPASEKINISFNLQNVSFVKNGVIKLYSEKSNLLKIIPISISDATKKQNIVIDVSKYPPGNYYYNIDINGKKLSSSKIIIKR